MQTFGEGNTDKILERCKNLAPTVYQTIVTSAHIKTMESRHDWDEASSTARSGWHSAVDPTDLPYMTAWMMKTLLKNEDPAAEKRSSLPAETMPPDDDSSQGEDLGMIGHCHCMKPEL